MIELLNKKVTHKAFGLGTVVDQDEKHITIEFSGKICKFVYPAAFERFLVPVESDVKEAVSAEIDAIKEAEVELKSAEVAKKAAEEQAEIEADKQIVSGNLFSRDSGI